MKNRHFILFKWVSYYQCSFLKLIDFFIYPVFYFTYVKDYGWWSRVKLFGKYYHLKRIKKSIKRSSEDIPKK